MPRVTIDDRPVEVPPGATVLDAARKLGIDVPALCHLEGYPPATSCMVCLVRLADEDRYVPACATPAEDGMRVESETESVHHIRRAALELLLSDHAGECRAPCQNTCPVHMDVPLMIRQVGAGDLAGAAMTARKELVLPAVLGRVCPGLCERTCRRGAVDEPVSIRLLERYVGDRALASGETHWPTCGASNGRRVAIVGAGPTGLAAACSLLQEGYACTVFDASDQPGGRLRYEFGEDILPPDVLKAEIAIIERMGVAFELGKHMGPDLPLASVRAEFDAVLVAVGGAGVQEAGQLGLEASEGRLVVHGRTGETGTQGVFVAGDAVRYNKYVVQAVAAGKTAAVCVDQYLRGLAVTGPSRPFQARLGRLSEQEVTELAAGACAARRTAPAAGISHGFSEEEARTEATRCLHCDCGKREACKLRFYAERYGARPYEYAGGDRRQVKVYRQHADVTYEPGKCILCGRCVQITAQAGERLGLTFIGRGFDVRVGVPFDRSLVEGLERAAKQCADACPTGALGLRRDRPAEPGP